MPFVEAPGSGADDFRFDIEVPELTERLCQLVDEADLDALERAARSAPAGFQWDREGSGGLSPLARACERADLPLAKALLEAGSNPSARSIAFGANALELAAGSHRASGPLCALLANRGAAFDEPDPFGMTPLAIAARALNLSALLALIDLGARLDFQGPRGETLESLAELGAMAADISEIPRNASREAILGALGAARERQALSSALTPPSAPTHDERSTTRL